MFSENEIVMLAFGLGILFFIIRNLSLLCNVPHFRILFLSYIFTFIGWVFTVIEGLCFSMVFNAMEHFAYAVGCFLLALWCYKIVTYQGEKKVHFFSKASTRDN